MMKLSTMKRVMETVGSDWRSPLAERILQKWGYDEGSVYCLRASANFVFVCKKEGKRYYLRFNDSSERTLAEIEAEINILQYLGDHSLHVSQPVKSLYHQYVEVIETELGTFYAVVFEAITGTHYDMKDLNEEQFTLWGRSLGNLHQTLKGLPQEFRVNRPGWRDHLSMAEQTLALHEKGTRTELKQIIKWAEGIKTTNENFGIVHYDFELDNVLFAENRLGMLDFDDCSSNWYVADIVYALFDLGPFNVDSLETAAFIEGYQEETRLDFHILQESSWLERMGKLVKFAKLMRSIDIEDSEDNPEWLRNLRRKLVGHMEEYRLSLGKREDSCGR